MRNNICEDCGRYLEDGEYCGCDNDWPFDGSDDWDGDDEFYQDDEGWVWDDEY